MFDDLCRTRAIEVGASFHGLRRKFTISNRRLNIGFRSSHHCREHESFCFQFSLFRSTGWHDTWEQGSHRYVFCQIPWLDSRAVKSKWFRFDSIFNRQVVKTFRYDSISIWYWFDQKTIRFDTKLPEKSFKKLWPAGNISSFTAIIHQDGRNIWKSPLWCSSMNLSFTTVKFRDFSWISFCPDWIVLKIEKVIQFDLHLIWFDLGQNIRFDNEIRFNFNLIWVQPCWIVFIATMRIKFVGDEGTLRERHH